MPMMGGGVMMVKGGHLTSPHFCSSCFIRPFLFLLLCLLVPFHLSFAILAAIYRSAQGPGTETAPGVPFERFWAPASECPKECLLRAFWPFLVPKGPSFRPRPLDTPVNGSRNRNLSGSFKFKPWPVLRDESSQIWCSWCFMLCG